MIYVFDTNSLSVLLKHFYPDRFPSLWKLFDDFVKRGRIISVREVYREMYDYEFRVSEWC